MTRTVRRSAKTRRKPEAASAPAQTTTPSAAADPAHDFLALDARDGASVRSDVTPTESRREGRGRENGRIDRATLLRGV